MPIILLVWDPVKAIDIVYRINRKMRSSFILSKILTLTATIRYDELQESCCKFWSNLSRIRSEM